MSLPEGNGDRRKPYLFPCGTHFQNRLPEHVYYGTYVSLPWKFKFRDLIRIWRVIVLLLNDLKIAQTLSQCFVIKFLKLAMTTHCWLKVLNISRWMFHKVWYILLHAIFILSYLEFYFQISDGYWKRHCFAKPCYL